MREEVPEPKVTRLEHAPQEPWMSRTSQGQFRVQTRTIRNTPTEDLARRLKKLKAKRKQERKNKVKRRG